MYLLLNVFAWYDIKNGTRVVELYRCTADPHQSNTFFVFLSQDFFNVEHSEHISYTYPTICM